MESNKSLGAVVAIACVAVLAMGAVMYNQRSGKLEVMNSSDALKTMNVEGHSTINVKPDTATVMVGLEVRGETAQAATNKAAQSLDAMLKTLDGLSIPREKVKTQHYGLRPDYRYNNGESTLIGYVVNSTLAITLSPMGNYTAVGPLLDKLVGSGANQIQGISFSLKDEDKVKQQGLEQAEADARSRADALAAKVGMKVIGVKNVNAMPTTSPSPRFMGLNAMAAPAASAPSTPIETGELDYNSSVTVEFLLG